MLIFLDTEYSGLSHPANARKLLSLALVAEGGSAEWYAELDGWALADCDPWVQRHVLPLLTGPRLTRDAARVSLQAWFAARPRHAQAACDSEIDWHFLLQLLGDRPSNLAAHRHDLAPLIDTASYNNALTAYFAKGNPKHHALHDARANRLGWLAWMDARKVKTMSCANTDNSLYKLADYPVLATLAQRRTTTTKLDGRTCHFIYQAALHEIDITRFSAPERKFFDALGLEVGQC